LDLRFFFLVALRWLADAEDEVLLVAMTVLTVLVVLLPACSDMLVRVSTALSVDVLDYKNNTKLKYCLSTD
jgi:hypothetical protein